MIWAEIKGTVLVACCPAEQPINQFVPVHQSRQQGLRGSCPNIYTVLSGLQCHELRKDWQSIVSMSQFIIQGISVTIIGIFGFAGNILSVIVLLQAQHFWLS